MSRSESDAGGYEDAVAAFARGAPVLIHDAADREGETDLIYPADAVAPADVARMRNDAGGLICVAVSDAVARAYELPFAAEAFDHPAAGDDVGYDERSSFSLTVNHRDTYTGITDEDRALTITELAAAAERAVGHRRPGERAGANASESERADETRGERVGADAAAFAERFRSPGHVHVLRGAPDLLADREGHTELGLALARAADRPPAVVVCEMLDDESGGALTPAAAKAYADREGIPYVEGRALVERLG